MVAWLLAVGIWLWAGSGDALAGMSTSDATVGSDTSEDAPAVSDGSGEVSAVGVVESAGSAGFVAESYARDYSVTVGEAGRRLNRVASLQEAMGSIRALEGSRVAGWGVDHGEDFGAWVWLAGDAVPGVEAARVAAAHDDVEIRTGANHTYEELLAAQDRIDPKLVEDDPEVSSKIAAMVVYTGIDMAANSVKIAIDPGSGSGRSRRNATSGQESDAEGFAKQAAELGEALQKHTGVGVTVTDASGFAKTANFRAGDAITTCTAGFAAKQTGGLYGLLTAGHCNNYQRLHGQVLPFVVGGQGPRADAQFHSVPFGSPLWLTNQYICGADADAVCGVTGTRERTEMMGAYVCKTGKVTGVSCGEVTDITISLAEWLTDGANACQDEDGNAMTCENVFVEMQGPGLSVCSGDSGAPVYDANGVAYGILGGSSGGRLPCGYEGVRALFTAIKEAETYLGVKVLTATPSLPGVPQNLEGRLRTDTAGVLELTWEPVEDAMRYNVYRLIRGLGLDYELIGTPRLPRFADEHGGFSLGLRNQYIVRAATNISVSRPSNDFQIDTITTKDLHAVVSSDGAHVELSWKLVSPGHIVDFPLFEIYRRTVGQGTDYSSIGREKCCSMLDTISGLPPGEKYVYRVRPINSNNWMGSWGLSSNYATVQIPITRPHARPAFDGMIRPNGKPFRGAIISWDMGASWDKIKDQSLLFAVDRRAAVEGQEYVFIGATEVDKPIYYDPLERLTPGLEYYYRVITIAKPRWWVNPPLYASIKVPALTDLKASVSPDSTLVRITWAKPVGDVVRYEVYRRAAVKGHAYAKIGESRTASYSDRYAGLVPGVEYYYRVKAVGASGLAGSWGSGKNYARAVAPAVGNIKAATVSGGVSVSWAKPVGDVVRYEVYRRAAVKGYAYAKIGETETASYSDRYAGLVPGVEYYYRVKAVGASGLAGSWGSGKNYARAVAPAVGNIKAATVSGGVSVSWAKPVGDVVRYEVYRRAAVKGYAYAKIGETETASYSDRYAGLVPGVEYYYRVKAVGASGLAGSWGPGPNYASIRYR